jgi:hypothetical protein
VGEWRRKARLRPRRVSGANVRARESEQLNLRRLPGFFARRWIGRNFTTAIALTSARHEFCFRLPRPRCSDCLLPNDLRLETCLATLDHFDAIILDDLGYVQQSRAVTRWRCCLHFLPSVKAPHRHQPATLSLANGIASSRTHDQRRYALKGQTILASFAVALRFTKLPCINPSRSLMPSTDSLTQFSTKTSVQLEWTGVNVGQNDKL